MSNKEKEKRDFPRNIRQIGEPGKEKRIYLEDYAVAYLREVKGAVLFGELVRIHSARCYFISGAVEIAEGDFSEENWNYVTAEAEKAFESSPYEYIKRSSPAAPGQKRDANAPLPSSVVENSLAVDAACSGNPGAMEYRGVHVASRQEIFHFGPVYGTNNIGEFLAIVHGLALLKQKGFDMPIYSDSVNAISWIKQKKCKTKLPREPKTEELFKLIERAEKWLRENTYTTKILKWETKQWGEIPADFGRK